MTYYSTSTLAPIRVPRAVVHDGRWWDTREGAPDRDVHLAAVGIVPLVDTARPADTDTHTHDRTVVLVDGAPTVVWTQREWTEDEQTARTMAGAPDLAEVLAARIVAEQNVTPPTWFPPTHTEDSWLPGAIALDADGKRWRNDHAGVNPWPLEARYFWTLLDLAEASEEWAPGVTYVANDEVTHLGIRYRIVTPHTSQVGWEPPNVPALWTPVP